MTDLNVSRLVEDIYDGRIELPDFQRDFVWKPEQVRELLVSVLADYFIGSLLILEQITKEAFFALRYVAGVEEVNPDVQKPTMVKILLDGQQRASALFYALYEPEINLRHTKPCRFYLDLGKALNKEWDKAVISVKINDRRKLEGISKNSDIVSFSLLRDIGAFAMKYSKDPRCNDMIKLVNDFMKREIHYVPLRRETEPNRIVETFERINRTGEVLSIFDLATARLYKFDIKLRDMLDEAKKEYAVVSAAPPEFILKVIALIRGEETKRKSILELEPKDFKTHWGRACEALQLAFTRVTDQKHGYGVLKFKKWMPYTPMIVPLAGMINLLRVEKIETKKNYDKIDRWYWSSVFSTRYDEAADTKSETDFKSLKQWFTKDSKIPEFIQGFKPDEVDLEVDRQSSAIYRGVMGMIVLNGAFDFMTGQPPQFDEEKVQDDHVFPKVIYKFNRISNRTLITSNAKKGDDKPSKYFKKILDLHGKEKFTEILESHLIPEDAFGYLLHDQLKKFVEKRKEAIITDLENRIMH